MLSTTLTSLTNGHRRLLFSEKISRVEALRVDAYSFSSKIPGCTFIPTWTLINFHIISNGNPSRNTNLSKESSKKYATTKTWVGLLCFCDKMLRNVSFVVFFFGGGGNNLGGRLFQGGRLLIFIIYSRE